jgi:hypothetical protein
MYSTLLTSEGTGRLVQLQVVRAFAFGPFIRLSKYSPYYNMTVELSDLTVVEKIKSGLRGVSVAMVVNSYSCSICKRSFESCDHEKSKLYDGIECEAIPLDFQALHVAMVSAPKDPGTQVTDMLVVESTGKKKKCTWYGFPRPGNDARFKYIQSMQDKAVIPNRAARHFSTFFINNPDGIVEYQF